MSDNLKVCWSCQGSGMMLGDNGDPCICSHCKYDGVAPREDGAGMSDDLKQRLRKRGYFGTPLFNRDGPEAADRIEELERENARLDAGWTDANARALAARLEVIKAVRIIKRTAAQLDWCQAAKDIRKELATALAELEGEDD